jgi:hypothetical protein
MSLVKAVRTLLHAVPGLPEAAFREVEDILNELEASPPASAGEPPAASPTPVVSVPPAEAPSPEDPADPGPVPGEPESIGHNQELPELDRSLREEVDSLSRPD